MTSTDSLLHAAEPGLPPPPQAQHRAQVEIVIPVRNEDRDLAPSVRRLHAYLDRTFPFDTRITIADNGSTDGTWAQALALAEDLSSVRAATTCSCTRRWEPGSPTPSAASRRFAPTPPGSCCR